MEEQKVNKKGGTMRLGAYECTIIKDSKSFECYKEKKLTKGIDTGMSLITNINLIWK